MRLVYLSGSKIPSREANSVHVMRMCQAMRNVGCDVTLVAFDGEATVSAQTDQAFYGVDTDMDIRKIPRRLSRWLRWWDYSTTAASAMARPSPCTLLYSRYAAGLVRPALAGIPFVIEAHAPARGTSGRILLAWLLGRRNFQRLVVISAALKEMFCADFPGLAPERIVVAHDGADLPKTPVQPFPLGGRDGVLKVGYVGHLYAGRGIDIVVDVAREIPNADFHIVGGTDDDIRNWRSRQLPPNLTFHGFVPPGQVAAVYAALDVFLAPYQAQVSVQGAGDTSRWMSPLKIFEYMAHGKPIICSDLPVLREVLDHNKTALLVAPADVGAWGAALRSLQDETLRHRIGAAAVAEIQRNYTWDVRARRILSPWIS